ncbi:MAG: class F sortase [Frankiales bacterium]|nr:class F sortase [Frankiales bacterium]
MTASSGRDRVAPATRSRPAGRRWRAAAVQAITLLALFAVQSSVLAGVRADRAAELGAGPVIPVTVPARAVALPVRLGVPALGLTTRLIGLRKTLDGRLQVPADPQRVGWYSQGVAPGDAGPAVLVGHVDSYRGPGVFARLNTLKKGDEITVRRADGSLVVFVVRQVQEYAKRDFPTKVVYVGNGTPTLRLVTCGGEFDRTSRSYLSNVVVFAALKGA